MDIIGGGLGRILPKLASECLFVALSSQEWHHTPKTEVKLFVPCCKSSDTFFCCCCCWVFFSWLSADVCDHLFSYTTPDCTCASVWVSVRVREKPLELICEIHKHLASNCKAALFAQENSLVLLFPKSLRSLKAVLLYLFTCNILII